MVKKNYHIAAFVLILLTAFLGFNLAGCDDNGSGCNINPTPTPTSTPTPTPTPTSTPTPTPAPTPDGGGDVGPLDPNRPQAPYPPPKEGESCGSWVLVDNVCTGSYCINTGPDEVSENCDDCDGPESPNCMVISSKAAMSGKWPEVHEVSEEEPFHYSRSTHFGFTSGGACGFGLYGLCTTQFNFTDPTLAKTCADFCDAHPDLCKDPANITLRGNFAAPQGNYYTQFWPTLPGERDNYLSCGECFEVIRTKKDGTDYQPGESGYTKPIAVQIVDSCPCNANVKWCCGSGRDNCEKDNKDLGYYKYACPTPPGDLDPDRDPSPEESIHLDLSDIAMSRLDGLEPGVIPIKYRRIPCPVVGNIHIRLLSSGGYYLSLNVINVGGLGSVVKVEVQIFSGEWVALTRHREDVYSTWRPQERYGAWREPKVLPPGPSSNKGPFQLPLTLRITDPSGRMLVAKDAIPKPEGYDPHDNDDNGNWLQFFPSEERAYFDTGVQF